MLPEPDPFPRLISAQLRALIVAEIQANGPLPFQRFMELALYAPGLGYYAAGAQKFGAAGDFVTAPELGNVWAHMLAQTLAASLRSFANPVLMELGAGSGAMAVDLLRALAAQDALPVRYLILERSADLRERQQQHVRHSLPDLIERVEWLDQPPKHAFEGAIVGNEVVDALVCARFVIAETGVREIAVELRDGQFAEIDIAPSAKLKSAVRHLESQLETALQIGYRSELIPELSDWFATISAPLRRGLILLSDYGYGRPEYYLASRHDGTLICHYRHRAHHDPYWYPGLNDISASVDFTALAEAAETCGFDLLNYDSQAGYLIAAGIEQCYLHMPALDDRQRLRLSLELQQLMLPGQMGERFKMMLLGRGVDSRSLPIGLQGAGQRRLL